MNFQPRYLVCNDDGLIGEYRIELRPHGDWSAQWFGPVFAGYNGAGTWGVRPASICIDQRDADGNASDWESFELARAACMHHQRLLATMGPQQAADEVARLFREEQLAEIASEVARHVEVG